MIAKAIATVVTLVIFAGAAMTTPARAAAACPNEVLRAELGFQLLPECRAYEMVSPTYKEGYPVFARSIASDGNSAIVDSLGEFAEDPGSTEIVEESGLYLERREPTGWTVTPLNPPSAKFVGQVPVGFEADNGDTLWIQHTPSQGTNAQELYRRTPDGVYRRIGPLDPSSSPEEAPSKIMRGEHISDQVRAYTSDYSHVIVEATLSVQRWQKKDATNGGETHSIYEYSGVEQEEPTLIAVEGEKGSNHLIATCGATIGAARNTSLGPEASVNAYNALSRDGETIFFTVGACGPTKPELYARSHGASTTSQPAEDAHVSASECTTACGESESGKEFEGASESGDLVYFTSTQKLTDDALDGVSSGDASTEGGCAETTASEGGCNLYLYDFSLPAGQRLRTVSIGAEVLGVAGVAEDGSRVYYVSRKAIETAGQGVYGTPPIEGQANLYAYDATTGHTAFITTLAGPGTADELDYRRENARTVEVAGGGGETLLFASAMPHITPDARSAQPQLYAYRAAEAGVPAELVRVSKGEDGYNENGDGAVGILTEAMTSIETHRGQDFLSTTNHLLSSTNGHTIVFFTTGQLSPRATSASQGCRSLYVFHTDSTLAQGEVHLLSSGTDTQSFKGALCGVQFEGLDRSGANVLFTTGDSLTPQDTDGGQRDLYDARMDGGFPPAPAPGGCDPPECDAGFSLVPSIPVANSTAIAASGAGAATVVPPPPSSARVALAARMRVLKKALARCRRKHAGSRRSCEVAARKRYSSRRSHK